MKELNVRPVVPLQTTTATSMDNRTFGSIGLIDPRER